MEELLEALKQAKQEMFDEMVEGNGRQPAEVVDHILFILARNFPAMQRELYEIINFYPDYSRE